MFPHAFFFPNIPVKNLPIPPKKPRKKTPQKACIMFFCRVDVIVPAWELGLSSGLEDGSASSSTVALRCLNSDPSGAATGAADEVVASAVKSLIVKW